MSADRRRLLPAWILRLAVVATCVAQATLALGDDDGDDPLSKLLERGLELRREHRNEEALEVFQQAARLAPGPLTLAQLALAEQAVARWVDAARDFDAALAASGDPWIAKNLDALVGAQAIVAQHVAWLSVQVDAANAEVLLDGQPIPQGVEVRVASGTGFLEARAPGRVPDIQRVVLEPAQHVRRAIALAVLGTAPNQVPPPAVAVAAPESSSSSVVGPLVLGVAGLAGLAVGTYFGIRTFQDKSASECPNNNCGSAQQSAYNDAQTSATVSTTAFVAGGVFVVGAGVWWLLARDTHDDRAAVHVTPVVGDRGGGIVVRGFL